MAEIVPTGEEPVKRQPSLPPPTLPLIEQSHSFDAYQRSGDYLPKSTGDVMSAAWDDALDSTAVGILGDKAGLRIIDEMKGQKVLSVPELNQKYMGSGITWTEPKKEGVADWIAEAAQKRAVLQNRMSLGEGGLIEGGLVTGANIVRHLMDPAEFAVNAVGGAAIRSASFAPAFLRGAGLASTVARGAVEGVVTQLPLEALQVSRDRQMERDVSLSQSLENIAMGAVYGGALEGLGYGAKAALQHVKRLLPSSAPKEWDFGLTESAAAQMLDGRRPNIKPFQDIFDRERNGAARLNGEIPAGGLPNPDFNPSHGPADGTFFVGTQSRNPDFHALTHGEYKNSRTNFGDGAYGQDDVMRANGYAASSFHDAPGLIHQFEVKGANLLSVDEPLSGAKMEAVTKAMSDLREFPQLKEILAEAAKNGPITARQVYEALNDAPDGAIKGFNANLKAEGYDGVHFVDKSADGKGRANGVMMFPESMDKVSHTSSIEPDQKYLNGLDQSEVDDLIRQHNARENRLFQSAEEDAKVIEIGKRAEVEPDLEKDILEQHRQEAIDAVKELADSDLLSPEELATFNEVSAGLEKDLLGDKTQDISSFPRIAETKDGFFGIIPKVKKLPEVKVSLKNGEQITLSGGEHTVQMESGATGRILPMDLPAVIAKDANGNQLGVIPIKMEKDELGKLIHVSAGTFVEEGARMKGVADAMYTYANAYVAKITESAHKTDMGESFAKGFKYDALDQKSKLMLAAQGEPKPMTIKDRVNLGESTIKAMFSCINKG